MASAPRDFLDRQVSRIQRDNTPPWWPLAQTVVGVVFVVVFAWQLMSGGGGDTPRADPPPPASTSSGPSSTSTPTTTPSTTPSTTPTASTGTVTVRSSDGRRVKVPAAAYRAVQLAFDATFNLDAVESVPMVSGETYPALPESLPKGAVSGIELSRATADEVAFVAKADPDGSGPQGAYFVTFTAIKDGSSWAITTQQ